MSGKPAARITDAVTCPKCGKNAIASGISSVIIEGLPAATRNSACECGAPLTSGVISSVIIDGQPAAVQGSSGPHGNVVIGGASTVIIGNSHTPAPFTAPAPMPGQGFDERFVLLNPEGRPLANRRYLLVRENGRQEGGITDAQGLTHLLAQHNQAENVDIYLATEE